MKSLIILLSLSLMYRWTQCQTAEELWSALQARYESLENYVDHGQFTKIIYGSNISTTTYDYSLAIDSQQNVWHSFSKWEIADAYQRKNPWSYTYQKSADQEEGVMIRNLRDPVEVPRTLSGACASLLAVGGAVLHNAAGLMFPGLYADLGGSQTSTFAFDTLIRLADTIMNAQECFVLEMMNTLWVSEEMIREREQRQDSIISLNPQPYLIPERPKQMPHESTFRTRYMIRKSDGLICQREVTHVSEGDIKSYHVQTMDPRSNVKGFEKYLWKGKS